MSVLPGDASERPGWRYLGFQTMRSKSPFKKKRKKFPGVENNEIDFAGYQIFKFSVFNGMFLLKYSWFTKLVSDVQQRDSVNCV